MSQFRNSGAEFEVDLSCERTFVLQHDKFARHLSLANLKFPFPHMVSVLVEEKRTRAGIDEQGCRMADFQTKTYQFCYILRGQATV
jgi:hypothetical protein